MPAAASENTESAGDSPGAPARSSSGEVGSGWRSPRSRTLALAAALSAIAGALLSWVGDGATPAALSWWSLAIMFGATELAVFHIEVRREAHTFTLSEIPLVLGLLFASPLALVTGRLIGAAILLGAIQRQPFRKLALNLGAFAAECGVAVALLKLAHNPSNLTHPLTWLAVLAAVTAADATSIGAVVLAMRWHGAKSEPSQLLVTNAFTVVTNTSLALLAALLLRVAPAGMALFAVMAAVVLLAYRGYTELHQRHASLQLLYDFTRLVSGSKRPDTVLEAILGKACELLRSERAGIILFGITGSAIETLWVGETASDSDTGRATRWEGPTTVDAEFLSSLVRRGTSLVVSAAPKDPSHAELLSLLDCRDCILAPVTDTTGVIGVLVVANRMSEVSTFDPVDGRLFESLANHASVALENGRLIDRLHSEATQRQYEALHDALTGLPNRAMFADALDRALADMAPLPLGRTAALAVAVMDLDHFKEINDTLGHHFGDMLLQTVAQRLRSAVGHDIEVARLGGDEFAFLVPYAISHTKLVELGRLIRSHVAQPCVLDSITIEVDASIGFALYPEHGTDRATLLQRADVAMYEAKTRAAERVEIYAADRDVNTPRRLALAGELRRAIGEGQLTMHYQPKWRLADGKIVGAEALVRWNHPELGAIPPDEFVPLAERTGLIQPFTEFVLTAAVAQLRQWQIEGVDVDMAINLSMRNLADLGLPQRIRQALSAAQVEPSRITLEITESTIMADPDKTLRIVQELAALGVRLSVDDFGTGYSSLAYLQRLPVRELKIDKSFVSPLVGEPGAMAIVRTVIDLARHLGLAVVAEGVEDNETANQLRLLGCGYAQGFLVSRPMPGGEFSSWVRERDNLQSAA